MMSEKSPVVFMFAKIHCLTVSLFSRKFSTIDAWGNT